MNQSRELIELTGTTEDVHVREAREDIRAVALRHTTDHADDQTRIGRLARAEFAEARPHLLLRVFADRARVVEDHVRVIAVLDGFVPPRAELPEHELAVEHVHLAAERFQVKLATHRKTALCRQYYAGTTGYVFPPRPRRRAVGA